MLDKLEFLIALARERHFRRAAEQCGVTQPTLSAGIKHLEESLGAPLVNRGSRYVGLTPEGERVLLWARQITGDARAMRQEVETLRRGVSGTIRLAVIPTALPIAARLCGDLTDRHPGVRFSIQSASSKAILGMIEDFVIDGGLTYLDNEPLPRMETAPIYQEGYRLVTQADGRFAGRTEVAWGELSGLPLCLFTPDMQNRRIVDQTLAQYGGGAPGDCTETNSSLVMAALVSSGRWHSIMPPALIEAVALAPSVVHLPIVDPQITHAVGLVVAEREPQTPLVRALVAGARRLGEKMAL
ncbi:MAG: LysR family transcriptional regulator [Caulobacteraceae bacterium]|nr:LysR family transcriptional regulator [Caulobacteraceae bacterium]